MNSLLEHPGPCAESGGQFRLQTACGTRHADASDKEPRELSLGVTGVNGYHSVSPVNGSVVILFQPHQWFNGYPLSAPSLCSLLSLYGPTLSRQFTHKLMHFKTKKHHRATNGCNKTSNSYEQSAERNEAVGPGFYEGE